MLSTIVPPGIAVAEVLGEIPGVPIFAEEATAVRWAVPKRVREFAVGRTCARIALSKLGIQPVAIPQGPNREPCWPPGIVGSITHCSDYAAAAVARAQSFGGIGIDAEVNEAMPLGLIDAVASSDERRSLASLPRGTHWDRLLFSAKEAVFKVWFPIAREWLDFHDVKITFDSPKESFVAEFGLTNAFVGANMSVIEGRYLIQERLLISAVTLRH